MRREVEAIVLFKCSKELYRQDIWRTNSFPRHGDRKIIQFIARDSARIKCE